MHITAHDNCKVALFDETTESQIDIVDSALDIPKAFDWTKWGTILAGVSILVTVIVAVLQ